MSNRKLGDTFWLDFTVHDRATGALIDAAALTAGVYQDDGASPILTPTVTKRGTLTGHYKFAVAATTGNGFSVGKSYNVAAQYIIGEGGMEEVTQKQIVERFTLDGKRVADLNDLSATNVQAALTSQGFTTARAPKLDKLDAAVTSRAAPADLGNLDVAVSTRLPSNDARLDNLDAAISTCATPTDIPALADIDASLSAAHGGGSWQAPTTDITSTLKKVKEVLALVRRIKHR